MSQGGASIRSVRMFLSEVKASGPRAKPRNTESYTVGVKVRLTANNPIVIRNNRKACISAGIVV